MSIEALAMAGADYAECGIHIKDMERCAWEQPPPYLRADEQSSNFGNGKKGADILIVNMCSGQQKKQARRKGLKHVTKNKNFIWKWEI